MRLAVAPLAVVLALAGCGGEDESGADASLLEGVPWVLASGVDVEGWEAVAPSASFEGGTMAGSTGCNRYTAPYTVDGDGLDLGEIASTQMACGPPGDEVERAFGDALGRVASWRLEDEELALLDAGEAEVLRFRAATPAGSWAATGFLRDDAVSSPLAGTNVSASFDEGEQLSGSAGCNTYRATYSIDGGAIEIGQPSSTKKLCPEPEGVMEQEAAYLAALPTAERFRVDAGSLQLLTAEGAIVATFATAPEQ